MKFFTRQKNTTAPRGRITPAGFTLIEVMISTMIFSLVMTVALGALLPMSSSDQKAEGLKSVVNNLNFALDSMTRTIRTGYNYHCGTTGTDLATPAPQNCATAGSAQSYLGFKAGDGTLVAYCLSGNTINREEVTVGSLGTSCSGSDFYPLTSSEVKVTNLQFFVTGACSQSGVGGCAGDSVEPKVTILISGTLQVSSTITAPFNLETSVTQRIYDQ